MSEIISFKVTLSRNRTTLQTVCDTAKAFTETTDSSTIAIYKFACDKAWENYTITYSGIEELLTTDKEIQQLHDEFSIMHNLFLMAKIVMNRHSPSINQDSISNESLTEQSVSTTPIKLQPIQIEPFDGRIDRWPEFEATCSSILTSQIPELQRLQHLKNAL